MKRKLKALDAKLYNRVSGLVMFIIGAGIVLCSIGIYDNRADEGFISLAIALAVAICIWIDFIIAGYFYAVAIMKGHKDRVYFNLAFYLTFVGYLLVVALPDRKSSSSPVKSQPTAQKEPNIYVNDLPEL